MQEPDNEPPTLPEPIGDPNQARLNNLAKAREAAKKKKAESIKIIPIEPPKEPIFGFSEPPKNPIVTKDYKTRRVLVKKRVPAPKRKREDEESEDANPILSHVGRFLLAFGGVVVSATLPALIKTVFPPAQLGDMQSHTETGHAESNVRRNDLFYDQSIFY